MKGYHHAPRPSCRTTPCHLSGTAYLTYSQLLSILETAPPFATWERAMSMRQGPTYEGMKLNHLCVLLSSGVCLVMSESGGNTAAIGTGNTDGSIDNGLFQVSVTHNGSWVRTRPRKELLMHILFCCNYAQHTKEIESFSLLSSTGYGNYWHFDCCNNFPFIPYVCHVTRESPPFYTYAISHYKFIIWDLWRHRPK